MSRLPRSFPARLRKPGLRKRFRWRYSIRQPRQRRPSARQRPCVVFETSVRRGSGGHSPLSSAPLKIEASDFVVDFFCHPANVEHGPLFQRVATPDVLDATHNDRIMLILHETNEESIRNIPSTQIVSEPEICTSIESKMSHPAFAPPSGFGRLLLTDRRQDHRPHDLPEIPATVDSPMLIEPDGFIRCIDHRLGRSAHSLESRQRQPMEAFGIILELGGNRSGYCSGDSPTMAARSLRSVAASLSNLSISSPTAAANVEAGVSQPSLRNRCLRCSLVSDETFPRRRSWWSSAMNCPAAVI